MSVALHGAGPMTEHKAQDPIGGGRPLYAYAELDFSYTPEQGSDPDW